MDNERSMKNKSVLKTLATPFLSLLFLIKSKSTAFALDGVDPITDQDFDDLNPLLIGGGDTKLTTPGGFISKLLEYAFPLAGIILFVMLVWGGFEMLYGATTSKSMEAGKNRVTAALIGFFLLFSSFWIIQILEVVFGINIIL